MGKWRGKSSISWTWTVAVFAAWPADARAHDERDGPSRCERVTFDVSLGSGPPGTHEIVGELCRPARPRSRTLQILLHGASFNKEYWNFPYRPQRYSYVRYANQRGFATLALDRLGSGESDRPAPELVTVLESASTIHQIVTAVRSALHRDESGRRLRFDRVVLVGNSFGSNIAWTEAALYADVDGLILTGISHDEAPPAAPLTQAYAYPANLDPKFAGLGLPDGYLTSVPGFRDEMLFHAPGVEERVLAVDELHKDTVPVGMLFDQFATYGLTRNIVVPVLNVIGDFDTLACQLPSCTESGSVRDEGEHYSPATCYEQLIVPGAGHALNLHENARSWYRQAQSWVGAVVEDGACEGF